MAGLQSVSFTNPDQAQVMEIERRQALAKALQQQSQEPIQQQQGGRFQVPISPWQGLAKMAQAGVGNMQQNRAQELARSLGTQQQARHSADASLLAQALQGRQAQPAGMSEDASGNVTQTDALPAQSQAQSLGQALPMLHDPQMQQMALGQIAKANEPFTLAGDAKRFAGPSGTPIAEAPKHKPPMMEHQFSVGENMVQPHISYDEGRTWQPVPGSQPSMKFAKQIPQENPQPVSTTTVMHNGVPTVVDARVYKPGGNAGVIGPANKPTNTQLPGHALTEQQQHLDAIGIAGNIDSDLGAVLAQLQPGVGIKGQEQPPALQLGLVRNAWNQARNYVGASSTESQNLGTFKATLEKLRNDSLRLNKGVQTEGDAQRAWNEIMSNINDQEFVKKRIGEVKQINERAVRQRQMQVDALRRNYNLEPMDAGQFAQQPAAINPAGGAPAPYAGPERRTASADPLGLKR